MSSGIRYVKQFNEKFHLPLGDEDVLSTDVSAQQYRVKFIQEELNELEEALSCGDKVKAFDALLDIAYVTYGTALFMGISPDKWDHGMLAVHFCNMNKVRVESPSESKRGHHYDVKKPVGWIGPENFLEEILG
jgi:predicted HAD superfamily Cof-like phosphohydrolase